MRLMFRSPRRRAFSHWSSSGRHGDRPGDPVPLQRRALDPEQRDLRLLGRAGARRDDAVATQALDLVHVRRVSPARHRVRRAGAELAAVPEDEGRHLAEVRSEGERRADGGGEAVLARRVPCGKNGSPVSSVPVAQPSSPAERGSPPLQPDRPRPAVLGAAVRHGGERGGVVRLDAGHGGVTDAGGTSVESSPRVGHEHVVGRRGDRGVRRRAPVYPRGVRVRLRAAIDRVERVVDGHVGHGVHPRLRGRRPDR